MAVFEANTYVSGQTILLDGAMTRKHTNCKNMAKMHFGMQDIRKSSRKGMFCR